MEVIEMEVPVIRVGGGDFLYSPLWPRSYFRHNRGVTHGLKFEQRKEGLPEDPGESCDQGSAKPPKSP